MDEQTTLRDTIESAIEEHSAPVEQVAEPTEGRARDEMGRFAAKEESPVVKENSEEISEPSFPVEERKSIPRPSSWKKDYEQDWETLPEKIREYINEREGQYAKGVSTYKSQWDSAQPIYEAIQPFMPDLQQHNISPVTWIQNLGNAHKVLALGTPEQKLEMFSRLATDYGVPLGALNGGSYDPQFSQLANELSTVKNQWQSFQEQQQRMEQQAVVQEIEQFKSNAPFFDEVRPTMAQLLQSGVATDLKDAYDKAIRLNDEVFQRQQSERLKAQEAERQKAIAEKKAKAVSPRSASPTGSMATSGGKKDLRSALSEAFDSVSGSI